MRLLLDGHIVLWALTNDARLSTPARKLILDENNNLYVSSATMREIIRQQHGRRDIGVGITCGSRSPLALRQDAAPHDSRSPLLAPPHSHRRTP